MKQRIGFELDITFKHVDKQTLISRLTALKTIIDREMNVIGISDLIVDLLHEIDSQVSIEFLIIDENSDNITIFLGTDNELEGPEIYFIKTCEGWPSSYYEPAEPPQYEISKHSDKLLTKTRFIAKLRNLFIKVGFEDVEIIEHYLYLDSKEAAEDRWIECEEEEEWEY